MEIKDFVLGFAAGKAQGGSEDKIWILNPELMDAMASNCSQAASATSNMYKASILTYAPYISKINALGEQLAESRVYMSMKDSYAGVSNTAFLGRRGYDRAGLIFATKIPGGVYTKLSIRFEITAGSFSGGYLRLSLLKNMRFGSDVWPVDGDILLDKVLASDLKADNTTIIDVSEISDDFYVFLGDYSGLVKIRALWVE